MYFKVSSTADFLLKGWSLQNVDGLLAAVIISMALSIIRECLAYSLYWEERTVGIQRELILKNVLIQIRRAAIHMINTALAYTLMLCVMTYNVWLLIIVSLASGFSYFFFRSLIERSSQAQLASIDQRTNISMVPRTTSAKA